MAIVEGFWATKEFSVILMLPLRQSSSSYFSPFIKILGYRHALMMINAPMAPIAASAKKLLVLPLRRISSHETPIQQYSFPNSIPPINLQLCTITTSKNDTHAKCSQHHSPTLPELSPTFRPPHLAHHRLHLPTRHRHRPPSALPR